MIDISKIKEGFRSRLIVFNVDMGDLNRDADKSGDFTKLYAREEKFFDDLITFLADEGLGFTEYVDEWAHIDRPTAKGEIKFKSLKDLM